MKKTEKKKTPKKPKSNSKKEKEVVNSKLIPLGNRVLIKPFTKEELEKKNTFGIILPDSDTKEKSEQGVVISVGPGGFDDGKKIPMTVKVGDRVVFSKYGYDEVTVGGEELYLIKEDNILAILK